MANVSATKVHEIITYTRVSGKLNHLSGSMHVETGGPLNKALNRLSCVPFVSFPIDGWSDLEFKIGGEASGTLSDPKIDVISKHSKASLFGRGEETVLDETYRRGQEVTAADFGFTNKWIYERFTSELERTVSVTLFVPRQAKVKLYKIAIYREGGHFGWHVDTTHSDSHHATVLVALNTSWTGGDFILRRNGVETRLDMKPKIKPLPAGADETRTPDVTLQAVAFYTDTEHKVEPITDGVRIVLQYDVEVQGWSVPNEASPPPRKKHKARHEDGVDEDEDEQDDDDVDVDHMESKLEGVRKVYNNRKSLIPKSLSTGDPAVIDEIVEITRRLLAKKGAKKDVAFALKYLYRKASILPEYLKGADSLLYQALSKTFEVSLHPVVLIESTDYEGCYGTEDGSLCAYAYPHATADEDGSEDGASNRDSDGEDEEDEEGSNVVFHLPQSSAIRNVSMQDYVEYTGNEAILGEGKYFGGGMFVKEKAKDTGVV